MEMKDDCVEQRELREAFRVFVDSHAMMRSHRKLRREVCIGRLAIFILLITCMTFSVLLYVQQAQDRKKNDENQNKKKENESHSEYMHGSDEVNKADETPFIGSVSIQNSPKLKTANLTWYSYHVQMDNFCKNICKSLIIPQEGIYRLSLQLTYCGENSEDNQQDLSHSIIRYPKWGSNSTILNVFETVYNKKLWCQSVSAEVTFPFDEGDSIMVQSNNADLIFDAGEWTTKNLLTIQFISKIKEY